MKYDVLIVGNNVLVWLESNSRNAKKHLYENGGYLCKVFDKQCEQLSEYRLANGHGHYCEFERRF